eukprot:CAMPEP_0184306772 /NCGR_PEP_ID=MMETSP1049-20130417/15674_1 /TAXON_ID=77928 /ORGANISM="Proteomonas sulcata, Strain CCMP704" /LENGTH=423 /DNA_ID=CAMNT_0026619103 /DNA_START=25 /DNA_END=1296 /DNA_ORIENTATION=-
MPKKEKDHKKGKESSKDKKEAQGPPGAKVLHPILGAAMYGRIDEVREYAAQDPRSLRSREADEWTVAHWAARRGYMQLMMFISERAPELLAALDNKGASPAHFAAIYGHEGILLLIGERDPASLMLLDEDGNSPAHDATRHNRLGPLKLIVDRCPSLIYGSNNKGQRPIDLAERNDIQTFLKTSEKASMVPAVQLQNLTKEARMLNAQNACLALYCRHHWDTSGLGQEKKHFVPQPDPEASVPNLEYGLINNEFLRTMPRAHIATLERVENRELHDSFMKTRDKVKERMGKNWSDDKCERWLFYLSNSTDKSDKFSAGKFRVTSGEHSKHGEGIYFAREASHVDDSIAGSSKGESERKMLLCRVVVGQMFNGKPDHKVPFTAESKRGQPRYIDTVVDSTEDPITFAIGEPTCAYPTYLITYRP